MSLSLSELRIRCGLRQTDVGSPCSLRRVERGEAMPGPRLLTALMQATGLDANTILAAARESVERAGGLPERPDESE